MPKAEKNNLNKKVLKEQKEKEGKPKIPKRKRPQNLKTKMTKPHSCHSESKKRYPNDSKTQN